MKYIKGFDGLRLYSIILVILAHLGVSHGTYFFSGSAGVNIFFAISGFLITSILLHERNITGTINLRNFFLRRFLRLLPPLIPFYIAILIFMLSGFIRPAYAGLIASMLYLYNFIPKAQIIYSSELIHTWSLAIEEQFYLVWPLLIKWINGSRVLGSITLGTAFLCLPISFLLYRVHIDYLGVTYLLSDIFFTDSWTLPALAPIMVGATLAIANNQSLNIMRKMFGNTLAGLLSLIVFIIPLLAESFIALPFLRITHATGAALILTWIYHNQTVVVVRILEVGVFRYLGKISYGIYIWQGFFVRASPTFTPKIWVHELPVNLLFTVLVAITSYELMERRIVKYKKRILPNSLDTDAMLLQSCSNHP